MALLTRINNRYKYGGTEGERKWQNVLNINTIRTSGKEKVYANNVVIHQILFVQNVGIENNIRSKAMAMIEVVREVLETLRNMDDAVDVICNLDAEAVVERMEIEESEG